jgi:phosphatidylglycerophosphate synthase
MADQPAPGKPISLAEVREGGQHHRHLLTDPTYARVLMRRISPYVTYFITRYTSLSADAVTALSIASGIAGGVAIAVPSAATYALAVFLLQLAYLLDVVDGEVARVRGTAGLRGTYLDLVGHFIQNRALYGAAGYVLMVETRFAPWAVLLALLGVAFASPLGEQARLHVLGTRPSAAELTHGRIESPPLGPRASLPAMLYWLYRRVAFLWNYPASMNLFSLALLVDAARLGSGDSVRPLALPALAGVFAGTLALKQLANAVRILRADSWKST